MMAVATSHKKRGHDRALAKMRREHAHMGEVFLPQVKSFINLWAPALSWLGVQYVVHHDRIDVIFKPTFAEYLLGEQLEILSEQRGLLLEMMPDCRVKRGRIGGAKQLQDDCWMIWPKR